MLWFVALFLSMSMKHFVKELFPAPFFDLRITEETDFVVVVVNRPMLEWHGSTIIAFSLLRNRKQHWKEGASTFLPRKLLLIEVPSVESNSNVFPRE